MKAVDIMTARVVTARPDTGVSALAHLMSDNGISAVPIVDSEGHVLGMVSEGDLLRREETGTERRRGRWLRAFADPDTLADEYVKAHGRTAADVMTRQVVSVGEDTPIPDIVDLLERHDIKRVPVLRERKLVGIVSRANLVRALSAMPLPRPELAADDGAIRAQLADELSRGGFASARDLNIIVTEGAVHLWGIYASDSERKAIRVAAAGIPGVRQVVDHLSPRPAVLYQV
jgi:CBS-domain-containing membrane protein